MKAMDGADTDAVQLLCDGELSFTVYYYEWHEGKTLSLQIRVT